MRTSRRGGGGGACSFPTGHGNIVGIRLHRREADRAAEAVLPSYRSDKQHLRTAATDKQCKGLGHTFPILSPRRTWNIDHSAKISRINSVREFFNTLSQCFHNDLLLICGRLLWCSLGTLSSQKEEALSFSRCPKNNINHKKQHPPVDEGQHHYGAKGENEVTTLSSNTVSYSTLGGGRGAWSGQPNTRL